ncbi:MAG TPA: protein kinase, partial [Pseudomonadota bacterium]|nr:protein kinase [Pseudomonadota bacterium]
DGASDGFSAWNDEMRLIMRLSHPNIVPCFDVGFDDQLKVWMLVLAYQEGGSLRRWMSDPALRRQIPAKQVLSDIASALLFAHKKGVIHRDAYEKNTFCFQVGHLGPHRRRNRTCSLTNDRSLSKPLTIH